MGNMEKKTFMIYNISGGFLWVTSLTFAGYFFGGSKIIKDNFEMAVFSVIIISLLPALFEYIKHKFGKKESIKQQKQPHFKDITETFKKENLRVK
jgi:membrane-associated protein